MKQIYRLAMIFLAGVLLIGTSVGFAAGGSTKALVGLKATAQSAKEFAETLPAGIRAGLSSSTQNLIGLAERWNRIEPLLRNLPPAPEPAGAGVSASGVNVSGDLLKDAAVSRKRVSDPTKDFAMSRLGGFTQVQTSIAWCGKKVVVGFNDGGSLLESYSTGEGVSFVGVARSTNKGTSFTDLGYLKPSASSTDQITGNAVVECTSARTFHYAYTLTRSPGSTSDNDTSEIGISKSVDSGKTWGDAVSAVSKPGKTHRLDKPWLAADPNKPARLFITYTDFDTEALDGAATSCPAGSSRTAIELVRSSNGGRTWSQPTVIAEVCAEESSLARVDGSRIAVGPAGEVYIAWEAFASDYMTREIDLRKSADQGLTFGSVVKVSDATPVGSYDALQGMIKATEFPALAVDTTQGSQRVYIAWNDGRNLTATEVFSGDYKYHFSDILLSSSADGGATWSAPPIRVNQNTESSTKGSDQFSPALAVDKNGNLGVCFYDRRADGNNLFLQRYCAYSTDYGTTWNEIKVGNAKSAPLHDQDMLTAVQSIGDYDTLAVDKLKLNEGFLGAFGDASARANWDVLSTLFTF